MKVFAAATDEGLVWGLGFTVEIALGDALINGCWEGKPLSCHEVTIAEAALIVACSSPVLVPRLSSHDQKNPLTRMGA